MTFSEHSDVRAARFRSVLEGERWHRGQRGQNARFAFNRRRSRVRPERKRQHFDHDNASGPRAPSAIDLPHPAAANARQDFVSAMASAGSQGHARLGVRGLYAVAAKANQSS